MFSFVVNKQKNTGSITGAIRRALSESLGFMGDSQYITHLSTVKNILCNFKNVPFLRHTTPRQSPFPRGLRSALAFLFVPWVYELSGDLLTSVPSHWSLQPLCWRRANPCPLQHFRLPAEPLRSSAMLLPSPRRRATRPFPDLMSRVRVLLDCCLYLTSLSRGSI